MVVVLLLEGMAVTAQQLVATLVLLAIIHMEDENIHARAGSLTAICHVVSCDFAISVCQEAEA